MVEKNERQLIDIAVDVSMASEGAIDYGYLREAPIEELILIRNRVKEICDKREAEFQRSRGKNRV